LFTTLEGFKVFFRKVKALYKNNHVTAAHVCCKICIEARPICEVKNKD
jgi:hypothetical protein